MEPDLIRHRIHEIRGNRVMLDFDIAALYEVETKRLNEAVKRNKTRFPEGFMFRLTDTEWNVYMRSQFATAYKRNKSTTPYAFTEHGVTMLASVLRSKKAIEMNIAIVNAFIAMRQSAFSYKKLAETLKMPEAKYDKQFGDVFEVLNYLVKKDEHETAQRKRKRIGFRS